MSNKAQSKRMFATVMTSATFAFALLAVVAGALAKPPVINDLKLMQQLEGQANGLMKLEKTVEMKTLTEGLGQKHCDIELPLVAPGRPMTGHQLYEECLDSVLVIGGLYKCPRCPRTHVNPASGFVITAGGAAVTNYHVMDSKKNLSMVAMSASGNVYPITKVLAADKANDVAIVQLEGDRFEPLPIASEAKIGEDVFVISHPDRRLYTFTRGIVSRYAVRRGSPASIRFLEITADYARGSSGAPVLNSHGQVVGVVSSTNSVYYSQEKDGDQKNLQMVFKQCIPSDCISNLIKKGEAVEEVSEDTAEPATTTPDETASSPE